MNFGNLRRSVGLVAACKRFFDRKGKPETVVRPDAYLIRALQCLLRKPQNV